MRRLCIIGTQKLFLSLADSIRFSNTLAEACAGRSRPFDLLICPSLINLAHVADAVRKVPIYVGAQNFHQEETGPFTGQVSLMELKHLNIRHVMVGHSELRSAGETDGMISGKIALCLKHHVTPIICLGESADYQIQGLRFVEMERSIKSLFSEVVENRYPLDDVIVAYEPSWISLSGDEDKVLLSLRGVRDSCRAIREILSDLFGSSAGENIRIMFGGGVSKDSIKLVLRELQIDGLLVGRASTNIDSFLQIIEEAEEFINWEQSYNSDSRSA
jgi:triosephosphate isomerase (TIM)